MAIGIGPVTFSLEGQIRPQVSHGEPREISGSVSATTVGHGQPRWVTAQSVTHWNASVLSC